eukprot:Hpha_TRINITY_DN15426_c1_g1::TRINITY_DN15426_c1_g1_i2::g.176541::m.176541
MGPKAASKRDPNQRLLQPLPRVQPAPQENRGECSHEYASWNKKDFARLVRGPVDRNGDKWTLLLFVKDQCWRRHFPQKHWRNGVTAPMMRWCLLYDAATHPPKFPPSSPDALAALMEDCRKRAELEVVIDREEREMRRLHRCRPNGEAKTNPEHL